MMTDEKLEVTALMSDEVTQDISAMLEEHKGVNVFDNDMFDPVWLKHDVPKAQQKYKMLEAGLGATRHKAYEGKRRTLWIRKGFKLTAAKGVAPMVLNEKFNTSVHLKSDLGYQHSVKGKHISGWFGQHDF